MKSYVKTELDWLYFFDRFKSVLNVFFILQLILNENISLSSVMFIAKLWGIPCVCLCVNKKKFKCDLKIYICSLLLFELLQLKII